MNRSSPKRPRTPLQDRQVTTQVATPRRDTPRNGKAARCDDILRSLNNDFGLNFNLEFGPLARGQSGDADHQCQNALRQLFWRSEAALNDGLDTFRKMSSVDHTVVKLREILRKINNSLNLVSFQSAPIDAINFNRPRLPQTGLSTSFDTSRNTSFNSEGDHDIFSLQSSVSTAMTRSFEAPNHQLDGAADQAVEEELDLGSSYKPLQPDSPICPPSPSPRPQKLRKLSQSSAMHPMSDRQAPSAANGLTAISERTPIQPERYLASDKRSDPRHASHTQRSAGQSQKPPCENWLSKDIPEAGFFCEPMPRDYDRLPLRVRYECLRLALHYGCKYPDATNLREGVREDYDKWWTHLAALAPYDPTKDDPATPQRSPAIAWSLAQDDFWAPQASMSGYLELQWKSKGPTAFAFRLDPLAYEEKSNRFFRKFGAHRFLKVKVPLTKKAPPHLTAATIEARLQQWLNVKSKSLLGCKWDVFYTKPSKTTQKSKNRFAEDDRRDVMFFAISGPGLKDISRDDVLTWHLSLAQNKDMSACKAYARIELGFSPTFPTLTFKPSQIFEMDDILGDGADEDTKLNDQTRDWDKVYRPREPSVMDDGCSIMSYAAATRVWQMLGQSDLPPSAFQARIGPWKGMWSVTPPLPYGTEASDSDIWIRTAASQRKWNRAPEDLNDDTFDPYKLTFEVLDWTRPISSSKLHFDLIRILEDRGVPRQVLADAIIAMLDHEKEDLIKVLAHSSRSVELMKWIDSKRATPNAGVKESESDVWKRSHIEKINALVDSGFEVNELAFLAELVSTVMTWIFADMSNELRISLPKSTSVMGIADPTGSLSPSEIHLQFSRQVNKTTHLHGFDALVARQPSLRASDVQRVHTVLKPELLHLFDVVVFPTTGSCPLAGKLQGGDYDGDKFWICWEPSMVQPFRNAPPPVASPVPEQFGIEVDRSKYGGPRSLSANGLCEFYRRNCLFKWEESFLAHCTTTHEQLRYVLPLNHDSVEDLADIHDLIIDASKNGYSYPSATWNAQQKLAKTSLPPTHRESQPLYKRAGDIELFSEVPKRNVDNIIDHLVFDVARYQSQNIIREIRTKLLADAVTEDASVSCFYTDQDKQYQPDVGVQQVFSHLKIDLQAIYGMWRDASGVAGSKERIPRWKEEHKSKHFGECRKRCRSSFKSLKPPQDLKENLTIKAWLVPIGQYGFSVWRLLKASLLFQLYHHKSGWVFDVAGEDLCALKAFSRPASELVISSVRADLKRGKRKREAFARDTANTDLEEDAPAALEEEDMALDPLPENITPRRTARLPRDRRKVQRIEHSDQTCPGQLERNSEDTSFNHCPISPPRTERQQLQLQHPGNNAVHLPESGATASTLDLRQDALEDPMEGISVASSRTSTDSKDVFLDASQEFPQQDDPPQDELSQECSQLQLEDEEWNDGFSRFSLPTQSTPYF